MTGSGHDTTKQATANARRKLPKGRTAGGREVTICFCGGGPAHEWFPHGGGFRILACPSDWPQLRAASAERQELKP